MPRHVRRWRVARHGLRRDGPLVRAPGVHLRTRRGVIRGHDVAAESRVRPLRAPLRSPPPDARDGAREARAARRGLPQPAAAGAVPAGGRRVRPARVRRDPTVPRRATRGPGPLVPPRTRARARVDAAVDWYHSNVRRGAAGTLWAALVARNVGLPLDPAAARTRSASSVSP